MHWRLEKSTQQKVNPATSLLTQRFTTEYISAPTQNFRVLLDKPSSLASWVGDVANAPPPYRAASRSLETDECQIESPGEWQISATYRTFSTAPAGKRTLMLQNLSAKVVHQDILDVVRGGALLDLLVRPLERNALVSFVDATAAEAFLKYTKHQDLYLRGKRVKVDISLAESSFKPASNVLRQIALGASRNMIIRRISTDVDEGRIREDLEHIHGLVVIGVSMTQGSAIIRLNAVHLALFARTCMRSRSLYRKSAIEFFPDECAEPLPAMATKARSLESPITKNRASTIHRPESLGNRFQMLSMDGTEEGSDDCETATTSTAGSQSAVDVEEANDSA
ncbi:MAG: hypothetical protein LQ340_003272 [Diploschistes diacapsis]|nr:MAG: hypothetical protein LQ340_003272 [Diploschistes diacapsis]